jgi:hypothetical protein
MLRVQIHNSAETWHITFEGRFAGEDAEHARMLITRCPVGVKLIADLTEVVFIDSVGEEVLSFFGRLGAEFIAPTSYTLDLCERLQLPVTTGGSHANPLGNTSKNSPRSRPHTSEPQNKKRY